MRSEQSTKRHVAPIFLPTFVIGFLLSGCGLHFSSAGMLDGISADTKVELTTESRVYVEFSDDLRQMKLQTVDYCMPYMYSGAIWNSDVFFANGAFVFRHFTSEEREVSIFEIKKLKRQELPFFYDEVDSTSYIDKSMKTPSDLIVIGGANHDVFRAYSSAAISGLRKVFKNAITEGESSSETHVQTDYELKILVSQNPEFDNRELLVGSLRGPKKPGLISKAVLAAYASVVDPANVNPNLRKHYTERDEPIHFKIAPTFYASLHIKIFDTSDSLLHEFTSTGRGSPRTGTGYSDAIEIMFLKSMRQALEDMANNIALKSSFYALRTRQY